MKRERKGWERRTRQLNKFWRQKSLRPQAFVAIHRSPIKPFRKPADLPSHSSVHSLFANLCSPLSSRSPTAMSNMLVKPRQDDSNNVPRPEKEDTKEDLLQKTRKLISGQFLTFFKATPDKTKRSRKKHFEYMTLRLCPSKMFNNFSIFLRELPQVC